MVMVRPSLVVTVGEALVAPVGLVAHAVVEATYGRQVVVVATAAINVPLAVIEVAAD